VVSLQFEGSTRRGNLVKNLSSGHDRDRPASVDADTLNAELSGKLEQLHQDLASLEEAKNVPQELMNLTFSF